MRGCQIAIMVLLVVQILRGFWTDVHGIKAREPFGFSGIITTILTGAALVLLYWKAGAFSTLVAP